MTTIRRLSRTILTALSAFFVTFYDPSNPVAMASAESARETARQLHVEFFERHVASVDELRASLNALKPQDAEAYYYINDAMISSQAQLVIDAARAKKLPTMFGQTDFAEKGALASYGVSFTRLADCRQNTSTECSPGPTRRAWRWSH